MKNRILIRVKHKNPVILASYLRYVFEYYYSKGYWKKYQHGSVFDSLRIGYVKDLIKKLGISEFCQVKILSANETLTDDDIVIHRVGNCGKVDIANLLEKVKIEYGFN